MKINRAYREELERMEQRYEGVHETVLCSRCKREFRATLEKGYSMPKEWLCPICIEDSNI